MAFRGTYEHTLDDRGRVAIPARYRHEFPDDRVVITPGVDGCLEIYSESGFLERSDRVAAEPDTTRFGRQSRRLFDARSFDTELDRQGRILIPAAYREMVGLNGAVVIVGRRECLEIWDPGKWQRELETAESSSVEPGPGG